MSVSWRMIRSWLPILFALLHCGIGLASQPDIVIFLTDDHTYRDSSVYGSTEIQTPHMEALAREGLTFDKAYVNSPTCSPSRAALFTGVYPANNGAEPNHSRPDADIKKLPAYLQEQGYEVVAFGKVGHYAQTPELDFDLARHYGYHENIAIPKAVEWLENRQSEKPLCLFVGSNWPHVPWPDTSEFGASEAEVPETHVDNPTTREWRARYLQAVRNMDNDLGVIRDAAKRVLGDDHFFLLTSDHGAQWPFAKWNLYDDGVRTPMIASWPGKVPTEKRTDALVTWVDILPTIVDVAGGAPNDTWDGRSFLNVLKGESDEHHDQVFITHSGDGNYNCYPSRGIITKRGYKYIRNLRPDLRFETHTTANRKDGAYWDSWLNSASEDSQASETVRRYLYRPAEELFELDTDAQEWKNLANSSDRLELRDQLSAKLDAWLEDTGDEETVYGTPLSKPSDDQPNIITILIDDMGFSDLTSFGGDIANTEQLDRLAAEGLRFTQFYVNASICSPSRVALTTGQYPQKWSITSYLGRSDSNEARGMANWLDVEAPSVARELKKAGYATGHFGKWHMGGQRNVGNAPLIEAYGFDRSLTNFEGLGPRILGLKDAYDGSKPLLHALGSDRLPTGPVMKMDRSEVTSAYVARSIEFINTSQAQGKPFYINLWPDDVHSPFFPPRDLREKTDGSKKALYAAVLEGMDRQLAPLFEKLRSDEKLLNNTVVMVLSDNGPEAGAGDSRGMRSTKGTLYEGGLRSPLIVWAPGLMAENKAGSVNEIAVLSSIDLTRSIYEISNTDLPAEVSLDGETLATTLLGKTVEGRAAPLFFRRPPDRPILPETEGDELPDVDNPDLAVRFADWKYTVNFDGSMPQLFDLSQDLAESNNLASAKPEVVEKLDTLLNQWNEQQPKDAGDPDYDPAPLYQTSEFRNPIGEGADPWVVRDPNADRYLWCFSEENRAIAIHDSKKLTDLGTKHIVWEAPESGPYSRQVWAPELHFLNGKWHIYMAASDGKNENHLTYVLVSETSDPFSNYEIVGPLATGDGEDGRSPNIWSIDMTPLSYRGNLYAIWSGWDAPGTDRQFLYIAPMSSPTEISGPRVLITANDEHPWEFTEEAGKGRGLHEGPQVIENGGRTFVTYSTGASWLPTYKLGILELTGADPLDPLSWVKGKRPIFRSTPTTYGTGHSCFVPSPDGSEWWHVFHAKQDRRNGWRRGVFIQPMTFKEWDLSPDLGRPVDRLQGLARPAGEALPAQLTTSLSINLAQADALDSFRYYGHHQRIESGAEGIALGVSPEAPVNDFRTGEKLVLREVAPSARSISASFKFLESDAEQASAGIAFSSSGHALGRFAMDGYYAYIAPARQVAGISRIRRGKTELIVEKQVNSTTTDEQTLEISIDDDHTVSLSLNGQQIARTKPMRDLGDELGVRVEQSASLFTEFSVSFD